jgi:heme-degrading monooxygenase HmoA
VYARVSTVKVQADKVDEAVRIFRESVIPALEGQVGFAGALLLTQPESGQGISITLWASPEDQAASETSGFYREQLAKFAGLFTMTPVRELYEVSVQTGRPSSSAAISGARE